jgi:23S rRNA (cytosine1962-C5)-methyltransferase
MELTKQGLCASRKPDSPKARKPPIPRLPAPRSLVVSRATAGFLERGHPWVRPDRFTGSLHELQPGQVITLVDERGRQLASALADPQAEVCARVFHRLPGKAFDPAGAVTRAWERRSALHADPGTDCYRLVHGEADFLPGLRVERYASVLVILVLADCIVPHLDPIAATLASLLPGAEVLIRDHRSDIRRAAIATRRWGSPAALDAEATVVGHELGVPVTIAPYDGLATGIYVDQRATRAWLRPHAAGKRVLNLFAYTGLFSTSLLAAGAVSALDLDLSAPALALASANARLAGVADRHRTRQGDCRSALAQLTEEFDLIIVDPPTSAQGGDGGQGGWILRRDYAEVLHLAWQRLAPDGLLVAGCNTLHGKPFGLTEAVAAACPDGSNRPVPEPGEDIPLLKGFPEGRPWRLSAIVKGP